MSWKLVDILEWLLFSRQVEDIISITTDRVGTDPPPTNTEINVQAIRSGNQNSLLQAELLLTKQLDPDQEMSDGVKDPTLSMLHRVQTDLQVIQSGNVSAADIESAVIGLERWNKFVERNCATGELATRDSERLMRGTQEKAKILTACAKLKTYSKNLFRALLRQSFDCDHAESQHEVRLMLPKLEDCIDGSVLQLNMFLASPGGKRWHEIECKTTSVASNADPQPWAVCELVDTVHTHGSYIHLHFNGEKKGHVLSVDDHEPQQRYRDAPAMSLAQIGHLGANSTGADWKVRMDQPDEKATRLLTLALALLCLSEKSWPKYQWSSNNIFPTFENDEYNNLYLSSVLSEPEPHPASSSEPAAANPYFISFARLLWETESGLIELPTKMWNEQPSIYLGLHEAISSGTRGRQEVKEVIIACLSIGNFPGDKGARCDFIYNKIVLPLWNIAKPPQISRPVNKRQQVEESQRKISNKGTVELYDIQETPKDTYISPAADQFIKYLNDFTKAHVPIISQDVQNSGHYDRIKVAIIDSGVVLRADWLKRAKKDGRFVEGKCWIAGRDPNNFDDSFGHGTHVAQQLLCAAPNAAIYIAKIADEKVISGDQTEAIAKAIEYAVDTWKVDIISLSLGLEAPNPKIEAAITKVTAGKSTLVFAAAGNHGIHQYQAWPAYRRDVIGINAADGKGGLARSFNPLPVPNRPNFATLGIGTRSTWKGDEVRRSGTSFAVPIAVAIAANMLEYSRRHKLDCERRLYSVPIMEQLLKSISREIDGFYFLMPWLAVCNPSPCFQGDCPRIHCAHCDQRLRAVLQTALCEPPLA
ncbi:hypothetical protein TWF173_004584 [Orbilia oligospora]|nr:hypothetical protein TWF173_004584 [Orbilia oligospora]